jgi:hypothetical protein
VDSVGWGGFEESLLEAVAGRADVTGPFGDAGCSEVGSLRKRKEKSVKTEEQEGGRRAEGKNESRTSVVGDLEDVLVGSVPVLIAEMFLVAMERLGRNEGDTQLLQGRPGVVVTVADKRRSVRHMRKTGRTRTG